MFLAKAKARANKTFIVQATLKIITYDLQATGVNIIKLSIIDVSKAKAGANTTFIVQATLTIITYDLQATGVNIIKLFSSSLQKSS
jgi:hypothetical protein